jgi:inosose dehydratase
MNRRTFLMASATVGVTLATPARTHAATEGESIATNTYPWGEFAKRDGKTFALHTDEALAAIASTGIRGYEPAIFQLTEFDGLGDRLKKHGLDMRSLYVNTLLHDAMKSPQSFESALAITRKAAELGTKIIVTNPSPIKWGGPENKTDSELAYQAEMLKLGAELRRQGQVLAYHNHDIELRHGGREFHHMLTATDPANVKFCLDAHWVYRGCGNSQVALFDTVAHYGERIVELHLRQSKGGVWTEVFAATGDIDYTRLFTWLKSKKLSPRLVLEQAVEKGSPKTLDAIAAHRESLKNLRAMG